MIRQHDRTLEPTDVDGDGQKHRRLCRRSGLSTFGSAAVRGPLSMVGMALGYLGLVAILSMAPFWHLAFTPYQSAQMVCTDFGGSR